MPHKDPVKLAEYKRECAKRNEEKLRAYQRARYLANPERWRLYSAANKDRINATRREAWRKYGRKELERARRYGITVKQLRIILAPGKCAICGRTDSLSVDHCHATKKVRGLLCGSCNAGLGRFRDNAQLLRAAADYIAGRELLR